MSSVGMSVEAKSAAVPGRAMGAWTTGALTGVRRLGIGIALPIGVAIAWELAVRAGLSDGRLVPPPSRVWQQFDELWRSGDLIRHTVATLARVAVGFAFGTVAGTLLGALAGYSSLTRRLIDPTDRKSVV